MLLTLTLATAGGAVAFSLGFLMGMVKYHGECDRQAARLREIADHWQDTLPTREG